MRSNAVKQLKEKVALSCRILGSRGVTQRASGHVSARVPGTERILIKARGPNEEALEFATAKDIISIGLNGNVLESRKGLDSPHETAMHLAVYRTRPEVMSVIHTHPGWVVILTACGKPLLPIFAAYNPAALKLLLDGIPLYPRSTTVVNDQLGEDFMQAMGDKKACVLLGHGMTTAGRSVEEATSISLNLFELARMNYLAYAIAEPKPVPERDIQEYQERRGRQAGSRTLHQQNAREASFWRYHKKLLGED